MRKPHEVTAPGFYIIRWGDGAFDCARLEMDGTAQRWYTTRYGTPWRGGDETAPFAVGDKIDIPG